MILEVRERITGDLVAESGRNESKVIETGDPLVCQEVRGVGDPLGYMHARAAVNGEGD